MLKEASYKTPTQDIPCYEFTFPYFGWLMTRDKALEWLFALFIAVSVCLFLFGAVGNIYTVKNISMQPNLVAGDVLWVNTWNTRHQFPYPSVSFGSGDSVTLDFSWKKLKHFRDNPDLNRNDIVVFDRPHVGKNISSVKRIAALPGETIKIRNRKIFINGNRSQRDYNLQLRYRINFKSADARARILSQLSNPNPVKLTKGPFYAVTLTDTAYQKLHQDTGVLFIRPMFDLPAKSDDAVWPQWKKYGWNADNFGPVYIPKTGDSLLIDEEFYAMYGNLIVNYEGNRIAPLANGNYLVNGNQQAYYTFAKDYYFVLGDNRHDALDSRFYGPIPQELIAGKATRVLFGTFANQKGIKALNKSRFWKPL